MLFLWLSIVCLIPFDMCRFDGSMKEMSDGKAARKPVMDRIINVATVGVT